MSENAYTCIIPGVGVKLAITLAIFTLGLKIIISFYNRYVMNDSYKFRLINFQKKIKRNLNTKLNLYKKFKDYLHDKCKIYEFDFYNKIKYLNVY